MKVLKGSDLPESFFKYREVAELPLVREIVLDVRQNGDDALKRYTLKYDGVTVEQFRVTGSEIEEARRQVDRQLLSAVEIAADNISTFARKQLEQFRDFEIEIAPGVFTGQKIVPVERVGIYVPGGRFPLISTLLMCALPAQIAGVREMAVCSPPSCNGSIQPAILTVADMIGINEIYRVGGAQAIAAMAYGTQSIRKVDKVAGPGNKYVNLAKKMVFGVVGIDFIAGPTELVIIADDTADPEVVAADLLAQAEHDIDAVPILVTTSRELASMVSEQVDLQLQKLRTRKVAESSIERNGLIILTDDMAEALHIASRKAPEHIALQVTNPQEYADKVKNCGSLFVGEYTAEVLGDYSSGINHTLPTNTCARYTGGLSVKDFIKFQTNLRVTREGLRAIGPTAQTLAESEGLDGHARSITVRLKDT